MKRTPFKRKPNLKKKKKRRVRSERDILKDKAEEVFHRWIRNRDKRCVTCNTGEAENAGHYYHNILDFDEMNLNGQCVGCNKWRHGNLAIYANYLIAKYGIKAYEDLKARHYLAMKSEKPTIEFYKAIIAKYTL